MDATIWLNAYTYRTIGLLKSRKPDKNQTIQLEDGCDNLSTQICTTLVTEERCPNAHTYMAKYMHLDG